MCKKFECSEDSHCRNKGTCQKQTGKCNCPQEYVGIDCALKKGKDVLSSWKFIPNCSHSAKKVLDNLYSHVFIIWIID